MQPDNQATLVADYALMLSTSDGRKLLSGASGMIGIEVGELSCVEEYPLTEPLALGEVKCFVCLQASHNVMIELTSPVDENPDPQNFPCGKFYLAYVNAANFVVKPISAETYVSLFFF